MYKEKLQERYEVNRRAASNVRGLFRSMLGGKPDMASTDSSALAVQAILGYFKLSERFTNGNISTMEDVESFLRIRGLFCHRFTFSEGFEKTASGPILSRLKDGRMVALLPTVSGYCEIDPSSGRKRRVRRSDYLRYEPEALNFFRHLSRESLSIKNFLKYCWKTIRKGDCLLIVLFCTIAMLLSLLLPVANKIMFSEVIPSGATRGILPICGLLLGAGISSVLMSMVSSFVITRVRDKVNANVQPALMARLMLLPSSFFRKYSTGDLGARVLATGNIYQMLTSQILAMVANCVFSILYIIVAFMYARSMVWLVTGIIVLYFGVYCLLARNFDREYGKVIPNTVKAQDFSYGAISGIHKIKNNRAEIRVFSQWARRYAQSEQVTASTSAVLRYKAAFGAAIFSFGNFLAWLIAWRSGIAVSDFIAFMSAFGVMQTMMFTLTTQLQNLAMIAPQVRLVEPIIKAVPEIKHDQVLVQNISGSIDVNHVIFSYGPDSPKVLDDVTLHIAPGENVGLVGGSGCGKSTLMRIMLGFEKPEYGSVFYGQYNVENVNLGTLRQYLGYCPQTLQIFPGTIADNIRLASPLSSDEEVWEAARIAGIDDDIRRMPLQMDTVLGEGGSGLSGGQCQRILIARSVINKPKVLFFDEATSALDNITQRKVMDNLKEFGCTRISIAHRLSTVMNCDRIIVLDKGRIVEDGSPEELLEQKGFFYKLCLRQQ